MKHIKLLLIALSTILLNSCLNFTQEPAEDDNYGYEYSEENSEMYNEENPTMNNSNPKMASNEIVMKTVMDSKRNMPMSQLPLPASWQIDNSNPAVFLTGPNGIRVDHLRNQSFMWTDDPYFQQIYAQSGSQLRRRTTLQNLFPQDFTPQLQQNGFKITKQYNLPELARKDGEYMNKLYQSMPSQKEFDALAVELDGPNNQSLLFILRGFSSYSQGLMIWGYHGLVLQSTNKDFENAKNALINGLIKNQHNPAQIAAYNREEQQKSQASWNSHNQRMASNQRNFNAQQAAFRNSSNAVNNSMMETWKNNNAASDRSHNQYINEGIWDQTTKTNPNTGQQYYVDNDANNYWMNSGGEYISTDDALYNPNLDPNYNNQDWTEMEDPDGGGGY